MLRFKMPSLPLVTPIMAALREMKSDCLRLGIQIFRREDVVLGDVIGSGSFGKVIKGTTNEGLKEVAVKVPSCIEVDDVKHYRKEVDLLRSMNHPNVVKLEGVLFTATTFSIIMEMMEFDIKSCVDINEPSIDPCHNLREFLVLLGNLGITGVMVENGVIHSIAVDCISGLNYLHTNNVVHRDFKPVNVLVSNGTNGAVIMCKLCDFGESRSDLIKTQLTQVTTANRARGTLIYNGPEQFDQNRDISIAGLKRMDIWSFGMLLFHLLNPSMKGPWFVELTKTNDDYVETLKSLMEKKMLPVSSQKDERDFKNLNDLRHIYKLCTAHNPLERPTTGDVLSYIVRNDEQSHSQTQSAADTHASDANSIGENVGSGDKFVLMENKSGEDCPVAHNIAVGSLNGTREDNQNLIQNRRYQNPVFQDIAGNKLPNNCGKISAKDDERRDVEKLRERNLFELSCFKQCKPDANRRISNMGSPEMTGDIDLGCVTLEASFKPQKERPLATSTPNVSFESHEITPHNESASAASRPHITCDNGKVARATLNSQNKCPPLISTERGTDDICEMLHASVEFQNRNSSGAGAKTEVAQASLNSSSSPVNSTVHVTKPSDGALQASVDSRNERQSSSGTQCVTNHNDDALQVSFESVNDCVPSNSASSVVNDTGGFLQASFDLVNKSNSAVNVANDSQDVLIASLDSIDKSPSPSMSHMTDDRKVTPRAQVNSRKEPTLLTQRGEPIVMLGNFHQAAIDIFQHEATGSQCSSISIMAVMCSELNDVSLWDSDEINNILLEGDKLHIKTLKSLGWPNNNRSCKLDLDEIPTFIEFEMKDLEVKASVGTLSNICVDLGNNLAYLLSSTLDKVSNRKLVIRIADRCMAVIQSNLNSRYYLFDPHCLDNEAAGTVGFETTEGLVQHLKRFVSSGREQVDTHVIDVTILSKDACKEDTVVVSSENSDVSEIESKQATPVFSTRQKGLSMQEIIQLCLFGTQEEQICHVVPTPQGDSVFVVDLSEVNVKDLSCDDLGIYDSHSSPQTLVMAEIEDQTVCNTTLLNKGNKLHMNKLRDAYNVKRQYSRKAVAETGKEMKRIISKVYHRNRCLPYATIQYLGDIGKTVKAHGNSFINEPFYRTKPSVLEKVAEASSHLPPKQVVSELDGSSVSDGSLRSYGDVARNRRQIYNVKANRQFTYKARNSGCVRSADFAKLIAEMDNGPFVKGVEFSTKGGALYPNTFAATDDTLQWLREFCSPFSQQKSQAAVDMTYKVGPYYTTCVTAPHPMFCYRSDVNKHPSILLGLMTSVGRSKSDYLFLANELRRHGINNLIYGTDGELALESAFETVFPIEGVEPIKSNIHLRCFMHVKDDILRTIKNLELDARDVPLDDILGREIGTCRLEGLVDCKWEDFDTEYEHVSSTWPSVFKDYFENSSFRVRSLRDVLKKNMHKSIRIEAGLGNPPIQYTNQRAESMNLVLKEGVGNTSIDQAAVHDLVFRNVIEPQKNELTKAIYCQGEYRLCPEFKQYEVSPDVWMTMTAVQRRAHIRKVLGLRSFEDAQAQTPLRKLFVQPVDCGEDLKQLPIYIIQELWHKAEGLLSNSHIKHLSGDKVCIVDNDAAFIVSRNNFTFLCQCEYFEKLNICAHVLVAADEKNLLKEVFSHYKYCAKSSLKRGIPPSAGEKKNKKPRKGRQSFKKSQITYAVPRIPNSYQPFTNLREKRPFQFKEFWHNDEPFEIVSNREIGPKTKCTQCSCVLSKKAMKPFDICVSHRERYEYPNRNEDGKVEWSCTKNKMRRAFYCVRRKCILNRFPYFYSGMLRVESKCLADCHKKLLNDELCYDIE